MKRFAAIVSLLLLLLILAACGDDGNPAPAQPTTATLKLSTAGTLAPDVALGGISASVILPVGVTVKTDAGGVVSSGVVVVSGVALPDGQSYAGATLGKLTFVIVKISGFGKGDFATINCDIAAGSNPRESDFSLADFKPVDLNGTAVSGLTASVGATIQ